MSLSRKCPGCGREVTYNNKSNLKRATLSNSDCRSCSITKINKTRGYSTGELNSQWKGYKEIPFNWFSSYFLRNTRGKRSGNITIKQVYNLWKSQKEKCALSGVQIGFYDDDGKHTCSIDRIDSSKEYVLSNIQLVHKDVNKMKNDLDQNYFIKLCQLISGNQ